MIYWHLQTLPRKESYNWCGEVEPPPDQSVQSYNSQLRLVVAQSWELDPNAAKQRMQRHHA
jgi:hypothetical protein